MTGKLPVRSWDPAPLPPDALGRKSPTVRVDKTGHGDVPFWNHVAAGGPKAKPCAECPWRRELWGRVDLAEYQTPEARETMWRGVGISHDGFRGGRVMMACHQGGAPSLSGEPSTYHECAGAAILIQRELLRWRTARNSGYDFERGLDRVGVENCAWHHLGLLAVNLLTAPWALIRERLHPGVTDPGIAHHELDPPTPAELEAWGTT